ncbi:MAG: DNA polymerase IV, partial [Phenylobacterium sp.]|nr:DNA polymerase IV [Phenylobacterium sp.]
CKSPRLLRHAALDDLSIAHVDCDAFYATIEKRDNPDLKDKPVAVGGSTRGVVAAACYVARTYGIRSAMPMFEAKRRCPHLVVVKPDMAKYVAVGRDIRQMMLDLTPQVEPLSIDEAFLDLTGTERLHGMSPAKVLARFAREVERDLGITISVGLSANKFLAKIASDLDKPRGFSVIGREEAVPFLARQPVGLIWGVGKAMQARLAGEGIRTIADLQKADRTDLARRFGATGLRLHALAHGRDERRVDPDGARKSVSAETTFNDDLSRLDDLEDRLAPLCERVARQARTAGVAGRVVTLKLRATDFRIVTRRRTLPVATQTAHTLFKVGRELLAREATGQPWRLIGVGIADLVDAAEAGADFFAEDERRALASERSVDALRDRFGPGAVTSGRLLRARGTYREE